ncbi:SctK family type III secretion system sorting platform protein [Pseudaminobacter sp. 19-2017]|uniref:SctK family type III secretion system sorting platform protein n=1 Tax=Pseudaminobacter soli (ex Zhang et al. 2022) TaxID=2831468 RepID=A0A942DVM4_9HYPH|nr:SctK family type III secretion system sorting platform protein [Pseudaminobacter soli]MBS3647167.1 SctK family type III secretion system sorting platform protein [Pseudaminobacter soli]
MAPAALDPEWDAFVEHPAAYADASQLAACFGGAITVHCCQLMLESPRLAQRLSALLSSHFELAPLGDDLANEDRRIALASMREIETLAMRAGAICWSGSLSSAIGKELVSAIHHQIGEELYVFALANRDLAALPRPLEPLETIAARIHDDGWRCIAAWCDAVPGPVSARMKLKFPVGTDLDVGSMTGGAGIVRRASEAAR